MSKPTIAILPAANAAEMNFKDWNEKDLKGKWKVTMKIDGVRVTNVNGVATSRNGNPLYNIPIQLVKPGCWYEVYTGTFKETISIVRASKSFRRPITEKELYMLSPSHDPKLDICILDNPTVEQIQAEFKKVQAKGQEGLVLQKIGTNDYVKVKPSYTVDLKITGAVEGNGRLRGMLGKFTTDGGDVGTGFSDKLRRELWDQRFDLIGTFLEAEGMEKTPSGKVRHPRFLRLRPDK